MAVDTDLFVFVETKCGPSSLDVLFFFFCRTLPDLSLNTVCLYEDSLIFDKSTYAYTAEEILALNYTRLTTLLHLHTHTHSVCRSLVNVNKSVLDLSMFM